MLSDGMPGSSPQYNLPTSTKPSRVTCLSITAVADPSVLSRVLGLIAMFDLIPERCHVSRSDMEPGRPLLIDLQIAHMSEDHRHHIQKKLERMLLVTQILCSEKRRAAA